MAVRERRRSERTWIPGLLALVSAVGLVLVLMAAMAAAKPEPDDPTIPTVGDNPYSPADFTYDENGYLTCMTGESVLGIDVSSYQGDIDWQQVRAAGVEFVMIRIGYRGYETGAINDDDRAQEYYRGARAAGLKVGAYFYSQAVTVQEAIAEADYAIRAIRGWKLEMPLVYDWEYVSQDARTADMDAELLTECTLAFCRTVRQAGYEPMVYFNATQSRDMLFLEKLTIFDWWLAMYTDEMDYPYKVQMWQYTSEGAVPGIDGPVDINLWLPE